MKIIPGRSLLPEKGIQLSDSQRRRLEKVGDFPRRVRISDRCWGYIEAEIDAFIEGCAAARDTVEATE